MKMILLPEITSEKFKIKMLLSKKPLFRFKAETLISNQLNKLLNKELLDPKSKITTNNQPPLIKKFIIRHKLFNTNLNFFIMKFIPLKKMEIRKKAIPKSENMPQ